MQAALVLLVIAGSTAWLALDASKRDWTDSKVAKNVPTWVVGSLLVWLVVFPLYVFVERKKAPLRAGAVPEPEPVAEPAVAMAAAGPSEQYGPSVDAVEFEPVVEIEPEPVVDVAPPEPVVEIVAGQPAAETEPAYEPASVATAEAEPVVDVEPEPVVEVQPQGSVIEMGPAPEPVVTPEPDPVVELEPELDPVLETEPEPDPVVEVEAEADPVVETEPEPVLEISYPDLPVDEAPPGLSVDAFKNIKPVSFGGVTVEVDEPASPAPEQPPAPEPVVEVEPEPVVEVEPEPVVEPVSEPVAEPTREPDREVAAAMAEPVVAEEPKPKKRGFRLPNPELKLPTFGKKKAAPVATTPATQPEPKAKGGLKLPQITLPPNLQGPLTDLERKIALGSVVAMVLAAALGYTSAP